MDVTLLQLVSRGLGMVFAEEHVSPLISGGNRIAASSVGGVVQMGVVDADSLVQIFCWAVL